DDEGGAALDDAGEAGLDAVAIADAAAGVGGEHERQAVALGELLGGGGRVVADADHLGARGHEVLVVVAELARLGGAAGGLVLGVEVEDHGLLAAEVREPDSLATGGGELEIWGGIAD